MSTISKIGYTANEIRLIRSFGYTTDVLDPLTLYRMCADLAFRKNMVGSHVEALRRALNAVTDSSVLRHTEEFDELIEF